MDGTKRRSKQSCHHRGKLNTSPLRTDRISRQGKEKSKDTEGLKNKIE